jgi:hypothetical protein
MSREGALAPFALLRGAGGHRRERIQRRERLVDSVLNQELLRPDPGRCRRKRIVLGTLAQEADSAS